MVVVVVGYEVRTCKALESDGIMSRGPLQEEDEGLYKYFSSCYDGRTFTWKRVCM